jgi:methyl-accepting chemotaxis protein
LMLVQTLVLRRSEDLLARVDRWVVDFVLPRVGTDNPLAERLIEALGPQLSEMGNKMALVIEPAIRALHEQSYKLGESLRVPIGQFAREMERLPDALVSFKQGADAIGRIGADLEAIGSASESLRAGVSALARIETLLAQIPSPEAQLEDIRRGLERAGASIDTLSGSFSAAYEKSSRATQEQLARSLNSLKDALEMLNVSMEQGNSLYRNIVKKLFDERMDPGSHRPDSIRVA